MNKIVNFLKALVLIIGLVIISIVNFFVITRSTNVIMTPASSEHIKILPTGILGGLFLGILIVVGLLFYRWAKFISPKRMFIIGSVIFGLIGIYLAISASPVLRYDQKLCLDAAININNHNFVDFQPVKGYLDKYPYQLGFVTFERIMVSILGKKAVLGIYILNLVSVIVINFIVWRLTHLIFKNKVIENYQILLNFLFIPEIFYVLFVYGTLLGFAFLLVGIFFAIRQWMENRKWDWLIAALCVVVAYQLKSNYVIGIIAIAIWSVIAFAKKHNWRYLALIVVSLGLIVASNKAIDYSYTQLVGKEVSVSKGVPKNLFVVMGLSKNSHRSDGWYNRYTIKTYKTNHGDYKASERQGNEDLKVRLIEMRNNPQDTANFFEKKLITTWTDPLFQSIWNGPHLRYKQSVKGKVLTTLYNYPNSKIYRIIFSFSHALYILVMVSILISLIKLLKYYQSIPVGLMVLLTYFIGGFIFHLVWETKSQYVINYLIALFPFAGMGAEVLFRNIINMLTRNTKYSKK